MGKGKNRFNSFYIDVNYTLRISVIVCLLFAAVFLISIIYLPVVEKKLEYLNLINASLVTILVLINLAYTTFTYQIVNESKTSRKIARAEKSLEKL
ncbi:MAG TPA: hypothetical protein C5S51_01010, partial [Methanosarcinaceae archaeon]|nr:hypothetical protein [Methanosarcinaceae archaeon]